MHTLNRIFATLLLTGVGLCAAPISFIAHIGDFENPPTGSPGTGTAVVTMDVVAHTLAVDVNFSGLLGTTMAAHIHCCVSPPGNAGVATQTPSFIGFPLGVTSGSFSNLYDTTDTGTYRAGFITANGGTAAGAEAALFAGLLAGEAYFNIHTSLHAGGEVRGFLVETPEPATFVTTLLGVGLLLARRKR